MGELLGLRLGGLGVVAVVVVAGLPVVVLGSAIFAPWRLATDTLAPSQRSLRTDLGYLLLSPLSELFARTLTTFAIAGCALAAGRHVGLELLSGFGPVAAQPRWLVVVEMLLLGDLVFYWTHRLAHTVPCLWRLHAVHHSTRHLRWSSAMRAHPAEAYALLAHMLPLFLLGFPVDALAPLMPLVTLYAAFIHSDVALSLRPVSYLVNSPAYHRWHHARDVERGATNFAGLFPIYDAIFGTYYLPEHAPRAVGIDEPDMPDTFLAQLAYPFTRGRRGRSSEAATGMVAAPIRVFAYATRCTPAGIGKAMCLALPCLVLACGNGTVSATEAGMPDAGQSAAEQLDARADASRFEGGDAMAPDAGDRAFDAGSDPARNAVQAGDLCARLAEIQCAAEATCCDDPGRDRASCEVAQFDLCANQWYLDAISLDPLSAFDAAHVAKALAQIERLAETCDPHMAEYNLSAAGLRGSFAGSLPLGANCGLSGIHEFSNRETVAIALASCGAIETTACLPTENFLSGGWTCAPRGDVGAPCFTHFNCKDGLSCPNVLALQGQPSLGVCTARNPAGTPCDANGQCTSLACVTGTCAATDDVQAAYCWARQTSGQP